MSTSAISRIKIGKCTLPLDPPSTVKKNDQEWLLYHNTTLEPLVGKNSCLFTKDSKCPVVNNLRECIDECDKDDACFNGIFIKSEESLCIPFHYYRGACDPTQIDPRETVVNKNCYPVTNVDSIETTYFMNSKYADGNAVPIFEDNIMVRDKFILTSKKYNKDIFVSPVGNLTYSNELQILSQIYSESKGCVFFRNTVRIGVPSDLSDVVLTIGDGTAQSLKSTKEFAEWLNMALTFSSTLTQQFIFLNSNDMQDKSLLKSGDTILIRSRIGGMYLGMDENGKAIFSKTPHIFTINMSGIMHYCDGEECKSSPVQDGIFEDGELKTQTGEYTYRREGCYGKCNWT